LNNLYCA